MTFICKDGIERHVMLETFFEKDQSTLEETTLEEVAILMLSENLCKHDKNGCKQLVYDEEGFAYYIRYCAICGQVVGLI